MSAIANAPRGQPIATALFANSPFVDGKPCGFKSFRSNVWCAAAPPRCSTHPAPPHSPSLRCAAGRTSTRHARATSPSSSSPALALSSACAVALGCHTRQLATLTACCTHAQIRRFCAGCAHVFCVPRRRVPGCVGAVLPRLHGGPPASVPGPPAHHGRLGGAPDHRVPRGPAEALPGDARRGQRAVALHLLAAGAVGAWQRVRGVARSWPSSDAARAARRWACCTTSRRCKRLWI